ncbi:MAG: HAD-IA family hydrolase [Nitrospiraceae bacterium]|nr:HAD-IA family hydrolase [Nitrospiraceae bacterium]
MDGTLLDTEALWVEATEAALNQWGISVSREEVLDLVYGISAADIRDDIARRYPQVAEELPALMESTVDHFHRMRENHDLRIPSSVQLLKDLAARYPVCIVSGSGAKHVAEGVAMMALDGDLEFALSSADYPDNKPNPACYRMAAERLELPPEACLVFEDSTAGILAAKGAGMQCVALARDGHPAQDVSAADLVLSDLAHFSLDDYHAARA